MKLVTCAIFFVLSSQPAWCFDSFEHLWAGDSVQLKFPLGLGQNYEDYPYRKLSDLIVLSLSRKDIVVPALSPSFLTLEPRAEVKELYFGKVDSVAEKFKEGVGRLLSRAADKAKVSRGQLPPYVNIPDYREASSIKLSFGEIVALAGDFIGNPNGEPISKRGADRDYLTRQFQDSVAYIWPFKNNPFYARGNVQFLQGLFGKELATLQEVINEQGGVHRNLARTRTVLAKIWSNVASDYAKSPFYLTLLDNNVDHFERDAMQAYETGHRLAIARAQQVLGARGSDRAYATRILNEAYVIEAFACHFLTDLFSAGHIRTPRRGLLDETKIHRKEAGLMANAMHDEDGWGGLEVVNASGERWRAFGDDSYFDRESADNRNRIHAAVQASVDEVFSAFEGRPINEFSALQFVPRADGVQLVNPLIKEENRQYLARQNPKDFKSKIYELLSYSAGVISFFKQAKNTYEKTNFYDYANSDEADRDGKDTVEVSCYTRFERGSFEKKGDYVVLPDKVQAFYIDNTEKKLENLKGQLSMEGKYFVVTYHDAREVLENCMEAAGQAIVEIRGDSSRHNIQKGGLPIVLYDLEGDLYRLKGKGEAYFDENKIKENIQKTVSCAEDPETFYLNRYKDVADAVRTRAMPSGEYHWINHGYKEGRQSCWSAPEGG